MLSNLDYALRYASLGWSVLPCHGKIPVRGTRGVHSATTDETRIRRWWGRHPDDDMALACNGQFWVLDVDSGHGGRESLAALTKAHNPLPNTVKQLSGGGGEHYFFRAHPAISRQVTGGQVKWWPYSGLDIRAGNALIAVCPTFHPKTGARYEWQDGCTPWERELADAPEWLIKLATPPKVEPVDYAPIQLNEKRHNAYWTAALQKAVAAIEGAAPGFRDETLNREAFSIGSAVSAGNLSREVALPAIVAASQRMVILQHDDWTKEHAIKKARSKFFEGIEKGTRGQKIALRT